MGRKSPHALQSCPQSKMLSITSRAACTSWHTLHACIATQSQRRRFSHKTRSAHSLATEAAQQQSLQRSSQWQEAHSRTAAHPTYPGGCCGATCQLPHQKLPLRRVLYFSLEEWEGGGGSKTRQVTLARHSHTHRGGRSRRERGCSQERSPQRPFRCTCVNSRWEKAGGGENGATNHGSNNCGAVSLLRTSVEGSTEQGNTADYYFTTHSHTTTISRTMEKDFSQAVTAEGKVNNLSPLSRSVSRRGTQRRGRRRKRWQVGGVAPPTPMFRGM